MASLFRNPTALVFIDEDNHELARVLDANHVPRVGENVRLAKVPYLVERVGYDIPDTSVERIWVVCRPA
jgi:ribosomal protein L10